MFRKHLLQICENIGENIDTLYFLQPVRAWVRKVSDWSKSSLPTPPLTSPSFPARPARVASSRFWASESSSPSMYRMFAPARICDARRYLRRRDMLRERFENVFFYAKKINFFLQDLANMYILICKIEPFLLYRHQFLQVDIHFATIF